MKKNEGRALTNLKYHVYYVSKEVNMLDNAKAFFWISLSIAILAWSACYVHGHFILVDNATTVSNKALEHLFK